MRYTAAPLARLGLFVLLGYVLSSALCSDAVARVHRVHKVHFQARVLASNCRAELTSQEPVTLGPMRYYGGPKSPMWRSAR